MILSFCTMIMNVLNLYYGVLVEQLIDYAKYPDLSYKVLEFCKEVSESNIIMYREIAMLWYWRCIVARTKKAESSLIKQSIIDIFGVDTFKFLKKYKGFDMNKGDFIVRGKTISELSNIEIQRLEIIAERRFYAFEWLFSKEDWDNVDLVC